MHSRHVATCWLIIYLEKKNSPRSVKQQIPAMRNAKGIFLRREGKECTEGSLSSITGILLELVWIASDCPGFEMQPPCWSELRTSVPLSLHQPFVPLFSCRVSYVGQLSVLWWLLGLRRLLCIFTFWFSSYFVHSEPPTYPFALPENFFLTRHRHVM